MLSTGSEIQPDDMTCTTKATAQHESDEENVIEQCPSPMPFKGSNAVSPEGEGAKPSFRRQQQEQDGADMLKVSFHARQHSSHRSPSWKAPGNKVFHLCKGITRLPVLVHFSSYVSHAGKRYSRMAII